MGKAHREGKKVPVRGSTGGEGYELIPPGSSIGRAWGIIEKEVTKKIRLLNPRWF